MMMMMMITMMNARPKTNLLLRCRDHRQITPTTTRHMTGAKVLNVYVMSINGFTKAEHINVYLNYMLSELNLNKVQCPIYLGIEPVTFGTAAQRTYRCAIIAIIM